MPAYRLFPTLLAATVFLLLPALGTAQPPVQPSPQAPTIAQPFPMGMQRGTTLDLTLTGANLSGPANLLHSFPAKVTIPTENNNGKDNAKLVVRLEVPKDAPLGWQTLRLATTRGVSNFRLFCIDDLPQITETDNNRSLPTAQAIPLPCVVCGRVDPELRDYFKFTVQAGQRLSFEVLGRRLGSGLDPQVSLLNPRSGKQIAFSDDAPGQGKDPRFTYIFKEAGEYVLELQDVRYMGGGDWFYRLRIGDFPCATTPVPLAAKRGSTLQAGFVGPNVELNLPVTVVAPSEPEANSVFIWPASTPVFPHAPSGLPGWPVSLAVTDLDEAVEVEPNDEPAQATRFNIPGGMSGRLLKKGDRDHFVFAVKKGQRFILEGHTQEYHSPTSVYLTLKNATGGQVAASNPATDPARIDFTAPADGDYTLAVEHLHYWGGPEESYRISVVPYEPGFRITAATDRFDVPQGGGAILSVQATRRDYGGAIEVSIAAPSGVTGTATIPAGQASALMFISATPNATVGGHRLKLIGKATINNKPITEQAEVAALVSRDLGNLPFPPRHLADQLALGVTEKPPFTFQVKFDLPEGVRGISVPVTITVSKDKGFDEEITVATVGLPVVQGQPPVVPPATAKIPKGQTSVKLELKPAANAPLGSMPLSFIASTKVAGKEPRLAVPLMPLVLALPFDLQVDAAGGKIITEGKHKIKVKAVRKGGYKGPIAVELRNLPANVTAPKAAIAENQAEVEVELTAAANAAIGDKADVNALGTATAAANQQNASGNFKLTVAKKPAAPTK